MSMSIQGGRPPKGLDALVSEVGTIVAADESADAQAAQLQAREHRSAAQNQRQRIEAQQKTLKDEQTRAKRPGIFQKALGVLGRVLAVPATSGYSLLAEAVHLATSKAKTALSDRVFAGAPNGWFAWFAIAMTPVPGAIGKIGELKQQTDRAQALFRDQAELEISSAELDKLRRAMTRNIELAKTSNERASASNDEFQKMSKALDDVSRAAARSIDG